MQLEHVCYFLPSGFTDHSPEEVRLQYYSSRASGDLQGYVSVVSLMNVILNICLQAKKKVKNILWISEKDLTLSSAWIQALFLVDMIGDISIFLPHNLELV